MVIISNLHQKSILCLKSITLGPFEQPPISSASLSLALCPIIHLEVLPFFMIMPSGLGLSLSYDIIKAHGGEISVNTKEGKYTEFVVRLRISS